MEIFIVMLYPDDVVDFPCFGYENVEKETVLAKFLAKKVLLLNLASFPQLPNSWDNSFWELRENKRCPFSSKFHWLASPMMP